MFVVASARSSLVVMSLPVVEFWIPRSTFRRPAAPASEASETRVVIFKDVFPPIAMPFVSCPARRRIAFVAEVRASKWFAMIVGATHDAARISE